MRPTPALTALGFLVLCLVIPSLFGGGFWLVGRDVSQFAQPKPVVLGSSAAFCAAVVGYWHWWDNFVSRGPKLGMERYFPPAREFLGQVATYQLIVGPVLFAAAFFAAQAVEVDKADHKFVTLGFYLLLGFVFAWFVEDPVKAFKGRGFQLRN